MYFINYTMNCITSLLIILIIIIICLTFSVDHFKPINSLKIKYNSKNSYVPDKLSKPTKIELSLTDKINSELSSAPLAWQKQIYSSDVYPHIGEKQLCINDSDCSMLTSECNHNLFDRNNGVGVCTLKIPDKTVFDIKY